MCTPCLLIGLIPVLVLISSFVMCKVSINPVTPSMDLDLVFISQSLIIVNECLLGTEVQPSVLSAGPVFDDNLCV